MEAIFKELEQLGTEQNRKVYVNHGVKSDLFGVSYANLKALQKKIGFDQTLSEELWATKNHDARVLATMIAEIERCDGNLLDSWSKDLDNHVLTGAFCKLAAKTTDVKGQMKRWISSDNEWISCSGWMMLSSLANNDKELADDFFIPYLEIIEEQIHQHKNRVREAMNLVLITIGSRNQTLMTKALEIAEKIGEVYVDHGKTSCKTPNAAEYIKKTVAHRNKKLVKS